MTTSIRMKSAGVVHMAIMFNVDREALPIRLCIVNTFLTENVNWKASHVQTPQMYERFSGCIGDAEGHI